MSSFRQTGSEVKWQGKLVSAGVQRFRYESGDEVTREKVWHPGAVGIVAVDGEHIWLTRQPREVVGTSASLEIPAGKRDVEDEPPLETAKRELAEEIGRQADSWTELKLFYTSPGFSDEQVWLYLAQGLSEAPPAEIDEDERIEIIAWPLDRLDQAFAECEDSKTLIALGWVAQARHRGQL